MIDIRSGNSGTFPWLSEYFRPGNLGSEHSTFRWAGGGMGWVPGTNFGRLGDQEGGRVFLSQINIHRPGKAECMETYTTAPNQ